MSNLMDIQQAFTLLLSDNNDLIQEVGAKGYVIAKSEGRESKKLTNV